ncbi:MAG: RNA polymerase factor sigma-54 [Elstera sp.]
MVLAPRLDLRQSQSLVMTPQLQQAIKLLQLSNMELSVFVEAELERNPLLEREEVASEPLPVVETPRDAVEALRSELPLPDAESPLDTSWADPDSSPGRVTETDGTDLGMVEAGLSMNGGSGGSGSGSRGDFDEDLRGLEETLTERPTLRQHLMDQVGLTFVHSTDRMIAAALVEAIDDAGYLSEPLLSFADQFGCDEARIESVLKQVQRFDPTGVGARSLGECLALQLAERNRLDPAMQALLDHLPLLAHRDVATLQRICGVDSADMTDMIGEIRALNPKPGLAFERSDVDPVTPDILMHGLPDGTWVLELNPETLPRVLVNNRYHSRVRRQPLSKADKEYISEQFQTANWLVKALHQRATTILKVASEIVRQQDAFFRHGITHLRPLILRDIAEGVGLHESTVSRVTTAKYIATPRGMLELKYFFTSAIQSADGSAAHSAEAVRYRIKALIDAEKPTDVLSDDKIVDILRADGVDIARRTVAKYREAMRISSSVQRRREKAFGI